VFSDKPAFAEQQGAANRYAMWDAEQDDNAAFEQRLDNVVREIGDRGKLLVPEAETPFREPTPAPAPAVVAPGLTPSPSPSPAPAPALVPAAAASPVSLTAATAPASTLATSTTDPVLVTAPQLTPPSTTPTTTRQEVGLSSRSALGVGTSFAEIVSFMREERENMLSVVEKQRQEMHAEAKLERATLEAKLEEQRLESQAQAERHRHEAQAMQDIASAKSCVSDGQLELLQTRLDALRQAKLLTDEEMDVLEDCVADYIDSRSSLNPTISEFVAIAEKVKKMVGLSEAMGKDRMLARQLRRKYAF
jgi:hypothetical protein